MITEKLIDWRSLDASLNFVGKVRLGRRHALSRMTAQELATVFRDGTRAVELAVLLTPAELVGLAEVVNAHTDRMVVGARRGVALSGSD